MSLYKLSLFFPLIFCLKAHLPKNTGLLHLGQFGIALLVKNQLKKAPNASNLTKVCFTDFIDCKFSNRPRSRRILAWVCHPAWARNTDERTDERTENGRTNYNLRLLTFAVQFRRYPTCKRLASSNFWPFLVFILLRLFHLTFSQKKRRPSVPRFSETCGTLSGPAEVLIAIEQW